MKEAIAQRLAELARKEKAPSGEDYAALSLQSIEEISKEMGISKRAVEIAALENGIIPLRYHRNIGSIGIDGQLKLRRSSAVVVGAGGLGGCLIELLARVGFGKLVVLDGETFAEDNLNRQLLCTEENIRRSKVDVAVERVRKINSAVDVSGHKVFVYGDNIDSLVKDPDIIIDALDNIPVRLILQDAASRLGIPLIHGAIAGFMGEVMSIFPGDRGLEAIFAGGQKAPERGIEVELGTPTVTPVAIAAMQVMEALKVITGKGELIRDRLLYLELEEGKVTEIGLSRS